jgi:hypothetical protein
LSVELFALAIVRFFHSHADFTLHCHGRACPGYPGLR